MCFFSLNLSFVFIKKIKVVFALDHCLHLHTYNLKGYMVDHVTFMITCIAIYMVNILIGVSTQNPYIQPPTTQIPTTRATTSRGPTKWSTTIETSTGTSPTAGPSVFSCTFEPNTNCFLHDVVGRDDYNWSKRKVRNVLKCFSNKFDQIRVYQNYQLRYKIISANNEGE